LLIPIVLAVIVYSGTAGFDFVNWDDDDNIRFNPRFTELSKENLSYHYQENRYKAIAIWTYMVEYQVSGASPKLHHITNLILHIINIVLVFFFIRLILPSKKFTPLIVAALFAVHPAFVEAVAWITGRKDLLFVLFSLLSFISYIKCIKSEKLKKKYLWFFISGVIVYLASLAKIQALALPVVLLALDWYFYKKLNWESIIEKVFLIFILLDLWAFALITIIVLITIKKMDVIKRFFFSKYYMLAILIGFWLIFHVLTSFIKSCRVLGTFDFSIWIFAALAVFSSVFLLLNLFNKKLYNRIQNLSKLNKGLFTILLLLFVLVFVLDFHHFNMIERIKYNLAGLNLKSLVGFWDNPMDSGNAFSFGERFLLMGFSFFYYIKRFFLLQGQNPMVSYPERLTDGSLPNYIISDFFIALIVFAIFAFILFKYFNKNRIVVLGILIFLVNISIVMHIIPIEGRILAADRYAYVSFWGLFIVIAYSIDKLLLKYNYLKLGAVSLICVFLAINSYSNVAYWKNSYTLWLKAVSEDKYNSYALNALGIAYLEIKENVDSALIMIDRALNINPNVPEYHVDKGRVLFKLDSLDSALVYFNNAILLDSTNDMAYNNRGTLLIKQMEYETAISDFETAIELNDNLELYKENYLKAKRLYSLDSVLLADYSSREFSTEEKVEYIKLASDRLIAQGKEQSGLEYLLIGLKLSENDIAMLQNVAAIYSRLRQYDNSIEYYKKLLSINPDKSEYYYYLANNYFNIGNRLSACENWSIAKLYGHNQAEINFDTFCKKD